MQLSMSIEELQDYLSRQLDYRFPDHKSTLDFKDSVNRKAFYEALERAEYCFQHVAVKGYSMIDSAGKRQTFFNHLNSDEYSQFLYFFSNSLWKMDGNTDLCSKLILLNRDLNGCWFSYKGNFPDIFLFYHPMGSVIGHTNVKFSNYLVVLQNVTINATVDSLELGKYLFLGAGSKIIGNGKIGDYVSIGANALVKNPKIPDHSIIYQDVNTGITTQSPNKKSACFAQRYFILDSK